MTRGQQAEKLMKVFWLRPAFHKQSKWSKSFNKRLNTTYFFFLFLFFFFLLFLFRWTDLGKKFNAAGYSSKKSLQISKQELVNTPELFPLDCTTWNQTRTCPKNYPNSPNTQSRSDSTCPEYFRWIHEDLKHWKITGITKEMVEKAKMTAHFRLVILDGRIYVEKYRPSIQTRAQFTLWGIVQLMRLYPGKLPDLDLMFDCDDRPVVPAKNYRREGPVVFRYCSDWKSLDIVFPDWSFWGWAETNIRPWRNVLKDISEGNNRTKWEERVPYAYWKGNPHVCPWRADLMKCNATDQNEWNARLYVQDYEKQCLIIWQDLFNEWRCCQSKDCWSHNKLLIISNFPFSIKDWIAESQQGYKQSNLGDQCTHRYKIYIEGWAWSVSEKYILACNSPTLYVTPHWYDFFIRGMVPQQHYWPIKDKNKCNSLKFAVDWGNNHTKKAKTIGEAGSRFIHEDLKMEHVYNYIFHLLNEYAKLLKYKPSIPPNATVLCSESLACPADGIWRQFMEESMEMCPSDSVSCTMPPPYEPRELEAFMHKKVKATEEVEAWETRYLDQQNKKG